MHSVSTSSAIDTVVPGHMERGATIQKIDECGARDIEPNVAAPIWDIPAATTQCGSLELDSLFTTQRLSGGVRQESMGTVARFGITPRLEVRWGMPGRITQSGGGPTLAGTTDQSIGACYRFHEQMGHIPDLAMDFAMKIPTANAAKGFGSGYTDYAGTLIASAGLGNTHVDFNAVGMSAGGKHGADAAAQFGLAMTRQLLPKLLGTLEVFGGSQPGTSDRYGAALIGGAWGFRPWFAINAAFVRAYTAASPRQQFMLGFIYTTRPGLRFRDGKRANDRQRFE